MKILGHAFLRSNFRKGDPVAVTAGARQQRTVANVLKYIQCIGGRFVKPTDAEGKNWMLVIDGTSDLPYPPGVVPPWQNGYAGPFAGTYSGGEVTVAQGWIRAGKEKAWDYPSDATGGSGLFDLSAKADGDWMVGFDVAASSITGPLYVYDASDVPVNFIKSVADANVEALAETRGQWIGTATVAGGVVTAWKQRQYGDIFIEALPQDDDYKVVQVQSDQSLLDWVRAHA